MPGAGLQLVETASLELTGGGGELGIEQLLILALMFVAVIVGVVYITLGQRRIPMQSAKHVRGRRVMGGTRQYLPLKVNQAGVMPIIFASSLLILPSMLFGAMETWFDSNSWAGRLFANLHAAFQQQGFFYAICYIALIYFFCFFWTAITFNPKDVSDNLKNYGSFIPGYRPGKRTADYLEKVMFRITYVGAGFLALVAIIPMLVSGSLGVSCSHLVMRNYKGLLES
jgi:preprotein translocase subunit SecY